MINRGKGWKAFSLYVRVRDAAPFSGLCMCCTCGRPFHYRDGDAGHFVPWNAGNAVRYHEQNVHAQCKSCNGFHQGAQHAYAKFVDKKYGEGTADRLWVLSKQTVKLHKFELDYLAKDWNRMALEIKEKKKI